MIGDSIAMQYQSDWTVGLAILKSYLTFNSNIIKSKLGIYLINSTANNFATKTGHGIPLSHANENDISKKYN